MRLMIYIKVPFFHMLDDLILDNICDRVKLLLFAKGEKVSLLDIRIMLKIQYRKIYRYGHNLDLIFVVHSTQLLVHLTNM